MNLTVKIKDNIVTLETLKHDVKINKEKVTVDPLQLFSRLLVIVEREYDMKQYLKYELTTIPTVDGPQNAGGSQNVGFA